MAERVAQYPIEQLFLDRWSPRAFTGEAIERAEFFRLIEAARWAPSAYNSQPWRFLYALRDTPAWSRFLELLVPFNRDWAQHAAALVFLVSRSTMIPPGKDREVPSHSHSFDAGAAWASLSLQAVRQGWSTHGMVGLDFDQAFAVLGLPPGWRIETAIAIGRRGEPAMLPEALRKREQPSDRLGVAEIAFEGGFPSATPGGPVGGSPGG